MINLRWINEIKKIGFLDWCWFVLYLRRNEFHPSLNKIKIREGKYLINERQQRRQRAHEIDLILS